MTHTITIDMDVKCPECRKPGAVLGGICLKCINRAVKDRPMKSKQGRDFQAKFKAIVKKAHP